MKILAFDIGGTEIKYAFCDESFNLTKKKSIPTNAHEGGKRIIGRIVEIRKSCDGVDRIGISTAGQVNSEKGEIIFKKDIAFSQKCGILNIRIYILKIYIIRRIKICVCSVNPKSRSTAR